MYRAERGRSAWDDVGSEGEGKKGGKERERKRAAGEAAGEALFPEVAAQCGARAREHKKPGMHFRVPGGPDDYGRSIEPLESLRSGASESPRRIGTRREYDEVRALVCPRRDIHLFRALSASIYVTLYTGPFRPLSGRRNTGFYQLLRRAPITGKL